jgi:hypothetical protein
MTTEFHTAPYLASLMQTWSPEIAEAFHGNAPKAFLVKANYIWQQANTDRFGGFVFYGPELAAYLNANGEEYILSSYISKEDFEIAWEMNTELYNISLQDPEFKIVQPLGFPSGFGRRNFKTTMMNGKNYNYYNLIHPGNDLGALITFDSDIDPNNYAEVAAHQINLLAKHLYAVLGEQPVYPNVKLNDLVINDHGVYWRFLYEWNLPKDGFFAKLVGEAEKSLQSAEMQGIQTAPNLLSTVSELWKKTLNI